MRHRQVRGGDLRTLREQADIDRADLAIQLGINEGYLKNIETGSDQPSDRLVYRWLRVMSSHLARHVELDEVSDLDRIDVA